MHRAPKFHRTTRLTRDQARDVLAKAASLARLYAGLGGVHPLKSVDQHNPRPGLRRWGAVNTATGVQSTAIECSITDFMALLRATAAATDNDEYDMCVGIEWTGDRPLTILTTDNAGFIYDGASTPLHRYTPVEITVDAGESDLDYHWRVHDLAQDCVNQGGISNVRMICPPERTEQQQ